MTGVNKKRIIALLLAAIMIIGLFPVLAAAEGGVAYLIVENTVFDRSNAEWKDDFWSGRILDMYPVSILAGDSIMDVTVRAMEENGISQEGAENNYISCIANAEGKALSELDGGPMSGWMITLNDWFINSGADSFLAADGDIIHWQYTCEYGEDLGGSWENNDTELADAVFSSGTLSQPFASDVYEYDLVISEDTESIQITPTAENKYFQTRIYKNAEYDGEKIAGEEEYENVISGYEEWQDLSETIGYYKRTKSIPVTSGDIITIACGMPGWNSMNVSTKGSVYTFRIVVPAEVTVGIYDYTAVTENADNASGSGVILDNYTVTVPLNTTAIDVFKEVFEKENIEYGINSQYSYIESVNGLAEFDCGYQSGWMFSINDDFGNYGANAVKVKDGDVLKLHYSVKGYGADVGSYFSGGPTVTKLVLGDSEIIISSNTVYADENDYTGITTYYLGQYTEGGNNTPLKGDGSIDDPYVIPVVFKEGTDVTGLTAAAETTLHPVYLRYITDDGCVDISESQNYSKNISFGLQTIGGFYKTYYTIKPSVAANASGGSGGGSISGIPSGSTVINNSVNSGVSDESSEIKTDGSGKQEDEINKPDVKFSDTSGHWAEEYIDYLAEKGIINGKENGRFAPEETVTRCEFVTMLYRISGAEEISYTEIFEDVEADSWYALPIAWAIEAGVANGVSDTEFAPEEEVTREQIAAFIISFAEYMNYTVEEKNEAEIFVDSEEISDWAQQAVAVLQRAGVINGRENNMFVPAGSATRAEAAKMLSVVLINQ